MAIRLPQPKPKRPLKLDTSAYSAPRAEIVPLTTYQGQYNDSKFYNWNGRIGRIQFLAYPSFFVFFAMIIFFVIFMAMGGMASVINGGVSNGLSGSLAVLLTIMWIGMLYIQFATTKRRLNDLNKTGWLSLILLVPFVSLLLYLYLLFSKGDEGSNDYGLPPQPPSKVAIWVGVILPVFGVAFLGIAAAIALPAYQSYVAKAKQAQEQSATIGTQKDGTMVASAVTPSQTTVASTTDGTLRQEEVVITGEQLGNGPNPTVSPTASPAEAGSVKPTNNNSNSNNIAPPAPEVAAANVGHAASDSNAAPTIPETSNDDKKANQIENSSQGTMSYEDFIKTSESRVYADR